MIRLRKDSSAIGVSTERISRGQRLMTEAVKQKTVPRSARIFQRKVSSAGGNWTAIRREASQTGLLLVWRTQADRATTVPPRMSIQPVWLWQKEKKG